MKLGYAIELVVAVVFGLGVWWCMYRSYPFDPGPQTWGSFMVYWVLMRGFVFLVGVSLVGGVGLIVESLRGRSPQPWGAGRWVWAITLLGTVGSVIRFAVTNGSYTDSWYFAVSVTSGCGEITGYLVALGITGRLLRSPKPQKADAREWIGRILGAAMVIETIIEMSQHLWIPRA